MTGDTSAVSTQKQRPGFAKLPPSLIQLVNDRIDEEQYDQAVELLEQLKTDGARLPKSLFQKLVALSLCSLAPGQVASTSRWTLDHQLHNIATRLLSQPKSNKGGQNTMKSAAAASDRPSPSAVLKASSLLVQYSEASTAYGISGDEAERQAPLERRTSLLARHILESLPSRRKPAEDPRADSPGSPRRARFGSPKSDESDQGGSFEVSSLERWVRDNLLLAEDVWDLLCGRQFSNPTRGEEVSSEQASEFWMNDFERRRYQRQMRVSRASCQRLEDRLKEIRWDKRNGCPSSDTSDSGSDDASDDDDLRLFIPGRDTKQHAQSKGRTRTASSSAKPAKRARTGRSATMRRDDEETQHPQVKMTEGAWRTLSVLLRLWERASPKDASIGSDIGIVTDDEPPLLWQFPRSHMDRQTGRSSSKSAPSRIATDEIDRALDVAFSFPSILPAYAPALTKREVASDLFDTVNTPDTRGHGRPISSVPEAELMHRQEVGSQTDGRTMAACADTAARLLESIHDLVRLGHISSVAFTEGICERMEALRAHEAQHLMLPLLSRKPYIAAHVLATYLRDTTRTRPDKDRFPQEVQFSFDDERFTTIDVALAYAMPLEETASTRLRNCSSREQNRDAKSVVDFLSLNKLELDSSANVIAPVTFPTRSESRKRCMVQKHRQRHVKNESHSLKTAADSADSAAALTEETKERGLAAFAFVRALQMEARDRINQMKFLVARALVAMNHGGERPPQATDPSAKGSSAASPRIAEADAEDDKMHDSNGAIQQQNLRLFLLRLVKAYQHDANDFQECVSAMKTHAAKDGITRRQCLQPDPLGAISKDGSAALPALDALADRCKKYLDATQNLVHATQFLLQATPRVS